MSTEHAAIPDAAAASHVAPTDDAYAPPLTDEWADEDRDELPPRPRRRLLGTGGNPVQLALLGVLLLAGGFIGGVLVEKGQTSSSPSTGAAGLASRLAALRGGAGGTSTGATGSGGATTGGAASGGAGSAGGGFAGGAGGGIAGRFGAAAGGATIGEVSYLSGSTLYVTDTEGNTIKVTTSPASTITKTVKTDVHGIHPGETVVVRGAKGSNGALSAETVSVSASGAGGGGLGALFGGGAGGSRGAGSRGGGSSGGGGGGGGEPSLFGK
jgi:hypothetical protein